MPGPDLDLRPGGMVGSVVGGPNPLPSLSPCARRSETGSQYVNNDLAVLKAKIKIKNPRIRAGIGPKPTIVLGKWQSGSSPGTPRGRGGQETKKKKTC